MPTSKAVILFIDRIIFLLGCDMRALLSAVRWTNRQLSMKKQNKAQKHFESTLTLMKTTKSYTWRRHEKRKRSTFAHTNWAAGKRIFRAVNFIVCARTCVCVFVCLFILCIKNIISFLAAIKPSTWFYRALLFFPVAFFTALKHFISTKKKKTVEKWVESFVFEKRERETERNENTDVGSDDIYFASCSRFSSLEI